MTENVSPEDGGGFRRYFPTLGYAVYGVGDTLEETIASLEDSKRGFERFVAETPGYQVPEPTADDIRYRLEHSELTECMANNNFAYAA